MNLFLMLIPVKKPMKKKYLSNFGIFLYRYLENIDGEKKKKIYISYKLAEKIKIWLLQNLINED